GAPNPAQAEAAARAAAAARDAAEARRRAEEARRAAEEARRRAEAAARAAQAARAAEAAARKAREAAEKKVHHDAGAAAKAKGQARAHLKDVFSPPKKKSPVELVPGLSKAGKVVP